MHLSLDNASFQQFHWQKSNMIYIVVHCSRVDVDEQFEIPTSKKGYFRRCYYIDNKEKRIFKRNKNDHNNTLTLDNASHADRFFISCCTSWMDLRQFNDSSNKNVVSFINMFTNRMKSFEELCFKMAFL